MAESFNVMLSNPALEGLEAVFQEAERHDDRGGSLKTMVFGGTEMQMNPRRPRGGKWFVNDDRMQVTFRSMNADWPVTVRYSAAGLWQYGLDRLRGEARDMLLRESKPRGDDWERVSEAHWAWDFYSPDFTAAMVPAIMANVICHSSSKKSAKGKVDLDCWGRGHYLETLDIGKGSPLYIQVYDKGKEITEASGKTWMIRLWEAEGFYPSDGKPRHVWRLEIRMRGKGFLRERAILRTEEMLDALPALLGEALTTRRLTEPNGHKNRWRWPLHPLWSAAYRAAGSPEIMMPLGRQTTEAPEAIRDCLVRTIAGTMRAATVLGAGDWDDGDFDELKAEVGRVVVEDEAHEAKTEKARERYRVTGYAR